MKVNIVTKESNPVLHGLLMPKYMRNPNERVSRWLLPVFESCWPNGLDIVDSIKCHRVNGRFNVGKLAYENETRRGVRYRIETEGLTRTFPTDKFVAAFGKELDKEIPAELQRLTFDDIGDDGGFPVYGTVDKSPESNGVSALVSFAIPVFRKDMEAFKQTVLKFVDGSRAYGYDLSSIDELGHSKRDDVAVLLVQFEARFSKDKEAKTVHLGQPQPLRNDEDGV